MRRPSGAEISSGRAGQLKVQFPGALRVVLALGTRGWCLDEGSRYRTGFRAFRRGRFGLARCFLQPFRLCRDGIHHYVPSSVAIYSRLTPGISLLSESSVQ